MESEPAQARPEQKTEPVLLWSLVALGLIALADTIVITIHHFLPGPPPEFAFMFGIPTAPAGIVWYLVIILVTAGYIRTKMPFLFTCLFALLAFEFLMGIVVFWEQTFVLKFFCEYAYLYVAVSFLMFFLAVILLRMQRAGSGPGRN